MEGVWVGVGGADDAEVFVVVGEGVEVGVGNAGAGGVEGGGFDNLPISLIDSGMGVGGTEEAAALEEILGRRFHGDGLSAACVGVDFSTVAAADNAVGFGDEGFEVDVDAFAVVRHVHSGFALGGAVADFVVDGVGEGVDGVGGGRGAEDGGEGGGGKL